MDAAEFERALRRDGYEDVEVKSLEAGELVTEHAHPFDVRALVLGGAITLTADGRSGTYGEGDVFTMARDLAHIEAVGPEGVRFLIGRRRSG